MLVRMDFQGNPDKSIFCYIYYIYIMYINDMYIHAYNMYISIYYNLSRKIQAIVNNENGFHDINVT